MPTVLCPTCAKVHVAPPEWIGRNVRCDQCSERFLAVQHTSDTGQPARGSAIIDEHEARTVRRCAVAAHSSSQARDTTTSSASRKLVALLELLSNLGNSLDLDQMLDELLGGLLKVFPNADRGFVALRRGERIVPQAVRYRHQTDDEGCRISRTIIDQVLERKEAILSEDVGADESLGIAQSIVSMQIRSLMCAPLLDTSGEVMGMVEIETLSRSQKFTPEDLDVLASVSSPAAIGVQHSHLHEESVRRQGLERDLDLAREVQASLLPREQLRADGYEFFAYYKAAQQVGGDYYDYIALPNNRVAVVLADVSGKGVSASLLMARVAGELRFLLGSESSPAEAIRRMNNSLCEYRIVGQFVTLVAAVLDLSSHQVILINAGHMPPLLRDGQGRVREVGDELHGAALGMFPDQNYRQAEVELVPGDVVTLFTDGIPEAENARYELYGDDRLRECVRRGGPGAEKTGEAILKDVREFAGDHPQSDDICLTSFGRIV